MKHSSLDCSHKLQVVTARMRFKIQAARMRFLCVLAGLTVCDKVRSSAIHRNLCMELLLLCCEGSQPRLSVSLVSEMTAHYGSIKSFSVLMKWRFSQAERMRLQRESTFGFFCLSFCLLIPDQEKLLENRKEGRIQQKMLILCIKMVER